MRAAGTRGGRHKTRRTLARVLGGRVRDYGAAVGTVAAAVLVSTVLERTLPVSIASFSLVFLTGVLIVAARTALGPALATAMLGFLAYNYFFTEPRFTFEITRPDELVAVVLFLVTGLIGGDVANRLRRQVAALRATNEQSRRLLELNRRLTAATDVDAIHHRAASTLHEFLGVPVCVLVASDVDETLQPAALVPAATESPPRVSMVDEAWTAASRTPLLEREGWWFARLQAADFVHGCLALRLADLELPPGEEELQLIEAYANQVALVLARSRLVARLEEARIAEETERLRSALLSSISHDLRTPLSSMIGAAGTLRDLDPQLSARDKMELLDALLSEGRRLDRYIENLLDMTRLGHGPLALKRDWTAPADIIAAAIRRLREPFPEIEVVRTIPEELPLLYVHGALIEQALFNVLENAARFAPPGTPVRLDVVVDEDQLHIDVIDEGPGMPESDRERLFEMFVTGSDGDSRHGGSGLGLAICRGMLEAHSGSAVALPGPGGRGTRIRLSLPITPEGVEPVAERGA